MTFSYIHDQPLSSHTEHFVTLIALADITVSERGALVLALAPAPQNVCAQPWVLATGLKHSDS